MCTTSAKVFFLRSVWKTLGRFDSAKLSTFSEHSFQDQLNTEDMPCVVTCVTIS